MADVVLDASAILAVIFDEPGAERVALHLPGAMASTVNMAEVMTKLFELGMPVETTETVIDGLQLTVLPFDLDQATEAARLRSLTREAGLSLGDRACLALAARHEATAVTADRAWRRLKRSTKVEVELIR